MKVDAPKANDEWVQGQTKQIKWTTGGVTQFVKIILRRNNKVVGVIEQHYDTPQQAPQQSYTWKVGENGKGIAKPTFKPGPDFGKNVIKITSPNSKSFWHRGQTHPIKWETLINPPFKIDLMNHNGTKLKSHLYTQLLYMSGGKYTRNWPIPPSQAPGKYRIKVSAANGNISTLTDMFQVQFTHQTAKYTLSPELRSRQFLRKQAYDIGDDAGPVDSPEAHKVGNVAGQARVGFFNIYSEFGLEWVYMGMVFRAGLKFDFNNYPGKNKVLVKGTLILKKKNTKTNIPGQNHCASQLYRLTAPWGSVLSTPADLLYPVGTMGTVWNIDITSTVRTWLQDATTNHGLMVIGINENLDHNDQFCVSYFTAKLELEYVSN